MKVPDNEAEGAVGLRQRNVLSGIGNDSEPKRSPWSWDRRQG